MGLNISKGNMYDFVTHTWNTVKGACLHNCSYCYMKRWGTLNPVRFDDGELKTDLGSDNFIFVGSSCDMFAQDIPMEWVYKTIKHCDKFDNKYLLQTKNPKRVHEFNTKFGFSNKFSICTTIETDKYFPNIMGESPKPSDRAYWMHKINLPKYLTIEPIMDFDIINLIVLIAIVDPIQINIGADTGCHKLPEPSKKDITDLIHTLSINSKLHQKRNLQRLLS